MANVSEIITLGIGTPSSIPYLILVGLGQGAAPDFRTIIGGTNPQRYDMRQVPAHDERNIDSYHTDETRLYDTRDVRSYRTREIRKYD